MRWTVSISALTIVAAVAPAAAQVIQLPSFHSFSVDTTVVVPDSGPRPVGTVRSGRAGSTLPGRSAGVERDAAAAAALAQIHDPRQADAALAREAQARRSNVSVPAEPRPQQASGQPREFVERGALKSVAQIERERASRQADFERETLEILKRARNAGAAGKPKVAAVYYSSAVRRATGSLKQQIEREWRQLDGAAGEQSSLRTARRAK